MNAGTIQILKVLLKNGELRRNSDGELWYEMQKKEIQEELDILQQELDFTLWRTTTCCYLIPEQNNGIFLQNNMDFRRDIRAGNDFRQQNLYLLNYLSIFLIFTFFNGEGTQAQTRDFIEPDELIADFTEHCQHILREEQTVELAERKYSLTFREIAKCWNALPYGTEDDRSRHTTKPGCVNMILNKLKKEDLVLVTDGKIKPTQRCRDLMPYFLRKDRVQSIHSFLRGEH